MMQQQQMNPHQAMYGQQFGQAQMLPSYGAQQQMNFMGAGMGAGMMQMMPQMMTPQQGYQMYQGGYGATGGHGGGGGAGRKRKQGGGHQNAKKWKK